MLICISSSDAARSRPRCPGAAQEMILFVENNNSHESEKRTNDLFYFFLKGFLRDPPTSQSFSVLSGSGRPPTPSFSYFRFIHLYVPNATTRVCMASLNY